MGWFTLFSGFIFSSDAMAALILVLLLIASFLYFQWQMEKRIGQYMSTKYLRDVCDEIAEKAYRQLTFNNHFINFSLFSENFSELAQEFGWANFRIELDGYSIGGNVGRGNVFVCERYGVKSGKITKMVVKVWERA